MNKNDLRKVRDALLNSAGHNPNCDLFTLNHNGNKYLPCDCGGTESLALLDLALAAEPQQPVAWMRKWAFDGDKPYKEKNANGRMAWSIRFKMLAVTKGKHFDDDVALYTAHRSRADRQGDE